MRRSRKTQSNPVNDLSEETIPNEGRKWNDILADRHFKGHTFEADVSKLVMKLVRHHDQNERETDGVVHWKSILQKKKLSRRPIGYSRYSRTHWGKRDRA